MSRGQFQTRTYPERIPGRCSNTGNTEKVVIEVDEDDDFVTAPPEKIPTPTHLDSRCSKADKPNGEASSGFVISLDDEDSDDDYDHNGVIGTETGSKTFVDDSSTSSSSEDDDSVMFVESKDFPSKVANSATIFSKSRSENIFGLNGASNCGPSSGNPLNSGTHETYISESDTSDCEIIDDPSGCIREEWEKAALRRKGQEKSNMSSSEENTSVSESDDECRFPSGTTEEDADFDKDRHCSLFSQRSANGTNSNCPFGVSDPSVTQNESASVHVVDANTPSSQMFNASESTYEETPSSFEKNESLSEDDTSFEQASYNKQTPGEKHVFSDSAIHKENVPQNSCSHTTTVSENFNKTEKSDHGKSTVFTEVNGQCGTTMVNGNASKNLKGHSSSETTAYSIPQPTNSDFVPEMANVQHNSSQESPRQQQIPCNNTSACLGNKESLHDVQHDFIGDREKHKESDLYKRALEEEWASRHKQLKIQAEEAQRLRRRKRAETDRLLDMAKRQKQRLEEVRELQKKDEETINLKEKFRVEVRKELGVMESLHKDMASLLRALGIHVGGSCFPLANEVNAAYKKALLKFHPDRASRGDLRQQVVSEEKFKLISRLKEKLLPAV